MALGFITKFWNTVTRNIIGFGVGAAAADIFRAPLADLEAESWALFPNLRLSPADLAAMVVQGIREQDPAAHEASESGYDRQRFDDLVRLNGNPPGLDQLFDLWRRGEVSQAFVEQAVRESRIKLKYVPELVKLVHPLLSAEQWAQAFVQGATPEANANTEARKTGVRDSDFELLKKVSGDPPGAGELFDLWNRGTIKEPDVDRGLRQSRLKPEWTAPLKGLRDAVAPVSDVIRFAVREVYDRETANLFGQFDDFPTAALEDARKVALPRDLLEKYWAAHWDLPSAGQGFEMLHRDLIDRPTLERLLKSLDVMPYWRSRLIDLAYNLPGRIDLRRMLKAGVINRAAVEKGYRGLGYSPADAKNLTEFAVSEKQQAERDFTKTEIVSFYEARSMPKAEAAKMLDALGFDAGDRDLIFKLADYRREKKFSDAITAAIRAEFIAGRISKDEASHKLDTTQTPPDQRDDLVDLWDWERRLNAPDLTIAQMQALLRRAEIEKAEFLTNMQQRGYSEIESERLAILAFPPAPPVKPPAAVKHPHLSVSELRQLFHLGELTEGDFRAALAQIGYLPKDVDRQIALARESLTVAQLSKLFKLGAIDEARFRAELKSRDYSAQDIAHLVTLAQGSSPARPPG